MPFKSWRSLIELYLNLQCGLTDSVLIKSSILNSNIGGKKRLFIYYIRANKVMNFIFNLHVYSYQCTHDTVCSTWQLVWLFTLDIQMLPTNSVKGGFTIASCLLFQHVWQISFISQKGLFYQKYLSFVWKKKKKKYTYTSTLHRGFCTTTTFLISNKNVSRSQPPSPFSLIG